MPFPTTWGETRHLMWRYRLAILYTTLVVGGAVMAWVAHVPDRYRASALIILRPQHFPEEYVRLMTTERAEAQVHVLREVLLSRTLLGRVVDEFRLYSDLRATLTPQEIIDVMRRDLTVQLKGNDVFMIAYQGRDPQTVAAVTNSLATSFVDLLRSEVQTNPVSQRVQFLEARLRDLDRQRADLSRDYTANFPEVVGVERALREAAAELDHERTRRGLANGPSIEEPQGSVARGAAQILDRAIVPEKPSRPYRRVMTLVGFVLGAGTGIAWVLIRSVTDHAFRDVYDFEAVTRIPVLGVVCRLNGPERGRRRLVRAVLGVGSGVVTMGGAWYLAWNFQEVVRWTARWWKGVW